MKNNNLLIITIFLIVLFNSIVYSAINQEMFINGEVHVRIDKDIRISNVKVLEQSGESYEIYNSDYSKNETSFHIVLPNNYSSITYEISIVNNGNINYVVSELKEKYLSNTNISYEFIGIEEGSVISNTSTFTFQIKFTNSKDDLSNQGNIVFSYDFKECKEKIWDFDYTGAEQKFVAPYNGIYKLEVWGAQGGTEIKELGKGGYSVGTKELKIGESLYVYVGEAGQNRVTGAFNGGGACYCYNRVTDCKGGGGGTDIRTTSNNNYENRVIVAGGGGGAHQRTTAYDLSDAGYGGGEQAGTAKAYLGILNSYANDGAIGGNCGVLTGNCVPRNCDSSTSYVSLFLGAGGGGYVGGIGIYSNSTGPSPQNGYHFSGTAGGGTGYIGGVETNLKYEVEKKSIPGNQNVPTYDGISTMLGNSGNGYAKISFLGN